MKPPKARWKKCPDCQEGIKEEGLRDAHELQVYFTNRIAAYLDSHGRRAMGWNEILQKGPVESAVLQYWLGNRKTVVDAIKRGRDVEMSSFWKAYLDHSYSYTSLSKAYDYEPAFPELNEGDMQRILGLEAPMWTEMVPKSSSSRLSDLPEANGLCRNGMESMGEEGLREFQGPAARLLSSPERTWRGIRPRQGRRADLAPPAPGRLQRRPDSEEDGFGLVWIRLHRAILPKPGNFPILEFGLGGAFSPRGASLTRRRLLVPHPVHV